jgi:hypothetical protein
MAQSSIGPSWVPKTLLGAGSIKFNNQPTLVLSTTFSGPGVDTTWSLAMWSDGCESSPPYRHGEDGTGEATVLEEWKEGSDPSLDDF